MVAPIIPILSTNEDDNNGFKVIASTKTLTSEPYFAFKGGVSDGWVSLAEEPHWFQVQSAYPFAVTNFAISGNIDSYVIKGSVDGINWMALYVSDEPVITTLQYKQLWSQTTWKYIKIEMVSNATDQPVSIKYLQFFN